MAAQIDLCNRSFARYWSTGKFRWQQSPRLPRHSAAGSRLPVELQCDAQVASFVVRRGAARESSFRWICSVTPQSGTCPFPWLYEYAYPSDCLKFRYLLQIPQNWPFPSSPTVAPAVGDTLVTPYVSTTRRQKFLRYVGPRSSGQRSKGLLTNTNQALGVYSYDCTNVDQFDASFTEALVAMVAAKLVMPLTGNAG